MSHIRNSVFRFLQIDTEQALMSFDLHQGNIHVGFLVQDAVHSAHLAAFHDSVAI